jgi:MinD-like ATPase involved in chromosome partitioning or flagellar assembly
MIITVGSVRGAPGATSWTMLLAAAWRADENRRKVVLEADPDGGVLGVRYGVGVDPGAISLASAARRSRSAGFDVDDHSRVIGPQLLLVPGAESADRATAVWRDAINPTAAAIGADAHNDWFIDCGRFRPDNPCQAFVSLSSMTLIVVGGRTEDLVQVPPVLRAAEESAASAGVLVVGKTPHSRDEIETFLGSESIFTVPAVRDLPAQTAAVCSGRGRRGWLWRAAVGLAGQVRCAVDAHETALVEAVTP